MATYIAVEGPDKVGKETQTKLLTEHLSSLGRVKRVEVPIHDVITYHLIYWMLRNGLAKKLPATFQFVQFLNKFLWQFFVKPWLSLRYDFVVLDRWSPSSVVYGTCEGLSAEYVMFLYGRLFKPDATIVLHGTSYKRSSTQDDSYEKDTALQIAVRSEYKFWALQTSRTVLVNNEGTVHDVHAKILDVLGHERLDVL